jgi:peptidoglycan/LPS O-acetylase OafA/YrhL
MDRHGGSGPGFDFLRLVLALLILYSHAFLATGSKAGLANAVISSVTGTDSSSYVHPEMVRVLLVPMFFAVSGFLVTGSAFRTQTVAKFMTFRILRIVPALVTEVTLSALLLGPIFTTVRLRDYFTDAKFFAYFGNVIGRVRFELPGVFWTNPYPGVVNVNLWTLQPEFYCYLATAVLLAASLLLDRRVFTILFVATSVALVGLNFPYGFDEPTANYPAAVVVYYFFCGSFVFHWRHLIPSNFGIFVLAVIGSALAMRRPDTILLSPLLVSYVIIYLGMIEFPRVPILQNGDYSYGIYLYGFPIQQALVAAFPALRGYGWMLLPLSVILTCACAMVSWHLIEKPSLGLKRLFEKRSKADSYVLATPLPTYDDAIAASVDNNQDGLTSVN